jgi:hypothetical protein
VVVRPALRSLLLALLLAPGLGSCVTALTQDEVEDRLQAAARPVATTRPRRVIPIYAETSFVAKALLTEARVNAESPLSVSVSRRMEIAAQRRLQVVVGGPYPDLTDQVVTNALRLQQERGLRGATLVFVSPERPSSQLLEAAKQAQARLYHREFH